MIGLAKSGVGGLPGLLAVPMMPLVPVGAWVNKWAANKVDKLTFERVIVALLVVSA